MGSYRLLIKRSAAKELEAVPTKDRKRIAAKIVVLAGDPRPVRCEKLSGADKYRLRQGDYRVVYGVDDAALTILIVKIGHRRDVYR